MNYIIVGTDTGVGKTYIACKIINREEASVGVYKPFETGVKFKKGIPYPADTLKLKRVSKTKQKVEDICFYPLKLPASPYQAAKKEKVKINIKEVIAKIKKQSKNYKYNFVELAGGLLVPLAGKLTNLDFIKKLGWPVIVVSEDKLGTINHTLMTLTILKANKIKIGKLYLNQKRKKVKDLGNKQQIQKFYPKLKIA